MKSIAVFCGSKPGNLPLYSESARQLGNLLGERKIKMIYGGAKIGLMGEIADAVLRAGGDVVGVLPDFLRNREIKHEGLTELYTVGTMHERKALMNQLCDGVIAMPGGIGTLDEVFEMLTWGQLGLHQKPIGFLNVNGYYDSLLNFVDRVIEDGFMNESNKNLFVVNRTPEGLLADMDSFQGPEFRQWLKNDQV